MSNPPEHPGSHDTVMPLADGVATSALGVPGFDWPTADTSFTFSITFGEPTPALFTTSRTPRATTASMTLAGHAAGCTLASIAT